MPVRLAEIETMLGARDDIADAAVFDYGGDAPILVIVKPHEFCSGPEIRDRCAADLGGEAERLAVILVAQTPGDTVDYPDPECLLTDAAYVYRYEPPATPTEVALISIWGEVLGRERTGVLDDFLDLGGDSVRAIQLIGRIDAELGVVVDLADFIDQPSVRALAALVDAAKLTR